MKKIKGLHRLKTDPYNSTIYITSSEDIAIKAYKEIYGQNTSLSARQHGMIFDGEGTDGDYVFLIYISSLSVAVHELSHMCLDVFKSIGADPSECNGEPYCYLMGYMFDQVQSMFPELT